MTLPDLVELDDNIVNNWDDWVSEAPDEWKSDGFISSVVPITVACRYGQDQALEIDDHQHVLAREFSETTKFKDLRCYSFALATHME
jgi:hypothetical protein